MKNFIKNTILCTLSLCNILCNAEPNQTVIDKATQYDLDISCQDKPALPGIITTITQAGKDSIEPFLAHPTDSITTLQQRQEIIRFLLTDALYSPLQQQLHALASHETALSLETGQLSQEALKQIYFTSEHLQRFNTSPYALDAAYTLHIAGLCLPAIEYLIFHAGMGLFAKAPDHDDHGKHHHHHDHHSACGCDAHISKDAGNAAFYTFHAIVLAMHISPLYHMGKDIQNRAVMIKHLQEQMIHVAAYLKTAQETFDLLQQHHADTLNFGPYNRLAYFFGKNPGCSTQAQKLLALLQESTFTGSASFVHHVGKVLAAYKLYVQVHQEFQMLVTALGELDAYVSVANIIHNQTASQPWCLVCYSQSTRPQLIAKNMRHLFIPVEQSKSWNITGTDTLHTFITGNNGVGKSTYINGIGHALILAQTFGIAPAREFEITPFCHICTYRFIQDNIAQGTSRFYAECGRIEEILSTVHGGSGLSCVLLDEPFTSTNAQKGSDFLAQALSRLFAQHDTISFTASHYTGLSALTKEHNATQHLHLS